MAERRGVEGDRVREYVLVPVHKFQKLMENEAPQEDESAAQDEQERDQGREKESGAGGSADPTRPGGQDWPGAGDSQTGGGEQGLERPADGARPGINSPPGSGRVTHPATATPSRLDSTGDGSTRTFSQHASRPGETATAGVRRPGMPGGSDGDGSGGEKAKVKRKGATIAGRRKRMRELWLAL